MRLPQICLLQVMDEVTARIMQAARERGRLQPRGGCSPAEWFRNIIRSQGAGTSARYHQAMKNDPCAYCGNRSEQLDHIFPANRRGRNRRLLKDNCTGICAPCNNSKRNLKPLHFMISRRIESEIIEPYRELALITGVRYPHGRLNSKRLAV